MVFAGATQVAIKHAGMPHRGIHSTSGASIPTSAIGYVGGIHFNQRDRIRRNREWRRSYGGFGSVGVS